MKRLISGREFIDALKAAGLLGNNESLITRVVIDARLNHVVVVHVERYGDERLLHVAQTLDGVKITERRPEPEQAA